MVISLTETQIQSPALTSLKLAARFAFRSEHNRHKMAAVVLRSGRIINIGWNKSKSHPKNKKNRSIHAELDAILGVDAQMLRGAKVVVVRVTPANAMATSKPCNRCLELLEEVGIKSITYIDSGGKICQKRLSNF